MAKKHYPTGLDDRMRDHDHEIRKQRSDTNVETLRETYGREFDNGYRSDTKLGTVLKKEEVDTLDQLLKKWPSAIDGSGAQQSQRIGVRP